MKKLSKLLAFVMIFNLFTACGGGKTPPPQPDPTEPPTYTAVLYADFTQGNADAPEDAIKEYPFEYTGEEMTGEALAAELTELTGLNFAVTVTETADGIVADWANDSSLMAGPKGDQKDEFFFFDNVTLSWFMMDSLRRTLKDNLGAEKIYYTMDGGKQLKVYELYPVNEFPIDIEYMGSRFYYAHDNDNDEDNVGPYARTKGLWRFEGEEDTASIEMDGEGNFITYYATGTIENTGYMDYEDENGVIRYDMYNAEGGLLFYFYLDSDTQLHLGDSDGAIYILDNRVG